MMVEDLNLADQPNGAEALKNRLMTSLKVNFKGQEIPNPYTVLNVSSTDSPEEIKKSYKKIIQSVHPDLYPHEEAVELSQIVNSSFELLADEKNKDVLDKIIAVSTEIENGDEENYHDEEDLLRSRWYDYGNLEKIADLSPLEIIDGLISCYPWLIPTTFWKSGENTLADLKAAGFTILAMDHGKKFYAVIPPLLDGKNYSEWVRDTESYGSLLIRKRAVAQFRILKSDGLLKLQK